MSAVPFFRVYDVPPVNDLIRDLYERQTGKYLVTLPNVATFDSAPDADWPGDSGTVVRLAVVDDFGSLRRVQ